MTGEGSAAMARASVENEVNEVDEVSFDGELERGPTVRYCLIVQTEGGLSIQREEDEINEVDEVTGARSGASPRIDAGRGRLVL
jgi:hypothetical protein